MKRSTRSSAGSGLEKSTKRMLPAGTVRTPWLKLHARPLLDLLAAVGVAAEVDAGDRARRPTRGRTGSARSGARPSGRARGWRTGRASARSCGVRARALLGLVGAPAGLLALAARRGGARAHRVARDLAAARALGEALELVGGLVDRLQVALVLELAPGGRDVGVPALGHPPARELHVALVERRLELQQEQVLLDVEDGCGHDPTTLATPATSYPACQCPLSTSSRCTGCRSCTRRTRRCSTTSRWPSIPGAKIGVLGYNGAGKSTLLRIMAGVDQEYRGEAALAPGATRRDARAGAAAGRVQGRQGQRRGRRRRDQGAARPLQRAGGQLLRGDRRGVRRDPGEDRSGRRVEPRHAAGIRDGRAAPAAARRRRRARSPAASAGAWRCAGCCCARPTCCCSTSPPTTSTPSRSPGSSSTWPSTRARSSPSPTTATSSTTSPAGSSSSTAARASPTRATTRAGSSRSRRAWPRKSARRRAASARSRRSSNGCARTPRANARSPRPAWRATRSWSPRSATSSSTRSRSTSRRARAWARRC